MYAIFLLYMKKPCATSTPCASAGGTPTCHVEVKAPTYIRSGCTDLRAPARTDFEPMAHHVKESNHCITDTEI